MLRRRHEAVNPALGNGAAPREGALLERTIKQLDVYARVDEDLQVRTEAGAAVTIGFWVLMVVLCVGEVQAYRKVQAPTERVVVDSIMGQKLRINIDMVSRELLLYIQHHHCCGDQGVRVPAKSASHRLRRGDGLLLSAVK